MGTNVKKTKQLPSGNASGRPDTCVAASGGRERGADGERAPRVRRPGRRAWASAVYCAHLSQWTRARRRPRPARRLPQAPAAPRPCLRPPGSSPALSNEAKRHWRFNQSLLEHTGHPGRCAAPGAAHATPRGWVTRPLAGTLAYDARGACLHWLSSTHSVHRADTDLSAAAPAQVDDTMCASTSLQGPSKNRERARESVGWCSVHAGRAGGARAPAAALRSACTSSRCPRARTTSQASGGPPGRGRRRRLTSTSAGMAGTPAPLVCRRARRCETAAALFSRAISASSGPSSDTNVSRRSTRHARRVSGSTLAALHGAACGAPRQPPALPPGRLGRAPAGLTRAGRVRGRRAGTPAPGARCASCETRLAARIHALNGARAGARRSAARARRRSPP